MLIVSLAKLGPCSAVLALRQRIAVVMVRYTIYAPIRIPGCATNDYSFIDTVVDEDQMGQDFVRV